MILIIGGTTEGRAAVNVAAQGANKKVEGVSTPMYIYSTLGPEQSVATPRGRRITGQLDVSRTVELCRETGVRLIVDAAHPFALAVHRMLDRAAAACGVPVVRFERPEMEAPDAIWCDDFEDAVARLLADGRTRLLALTGVRTIPRLHAFWRLHHTKVRILDRPASIAEAIGYGFPRENLVLGDANERDFGKDFSVFDGDDFDAIITKESGAVGVFSEKVAFARARAIPLYVVRRPPLPSNFITVYTGAGLRRRIEELVPDYFELRSGLSTGACATAASVAALRGLSAGDKVSVVLPGGERVTLPVEAAASGEATVRKDAGDDPDVTNGCLITAQVELTDGGGIRFFRGSGVGKVKLPGLMLKVGEPAINPAPRRMIVDNFAALGVTNADVTISVENGSALAKKTLNPRLGIFGGISILGTNGFVQPYSVKAFVDAISISIDVAWAVGCRQLVVNSGSKSESAVRARFPGLPPQAFVHYGNFVGAALELATKKGFEKVTVGAMIGKLVKLAEGHLDTHSKYTRMNREFLAGLAAEAGCSPEAVAHVHQIAFARELWGLPPDDLARFVARLLDTCLAHLRPLCPGVDILLIDEEGALYGVERDASIG